MSDSADDLILKMQHLEAQAKATREADRLRSGTSRLKSAAQKLAWESSREVTQLENAIEESDAALDAIRKDGVKPKGSRRRFFRPYRDRRPERRPAKSKGCVDLRVSAHELDANRGPASAGDEEQREPALVGAVPGVEVP